MDANLDPQKSAKGQRVSWLAETEEADAPQQCDSSDPFLEAARGASERLEIVEQIGKGGMAVVYKARHLVMNKMVAVKLLLPHLTNDPTSLKRFQQEAQATATLSHSNIVHVHDCGLTDGQAFIIMDFVEGRSLEQIIREEALTPERAIEIFVQISEALNHAHERGIIHRDLKPSNVMLTTDKNGFDVVKVVDFGIAKLLTNEEGTMNNLTQTGDVFGSPLYMSPEQCAGKKLDNRSDIYSLGCLMYEALVGHAPIVGMNFLDTMQKHLTDLPESFPQELLKNPLAKKLQVIIFTCLAKEPSARYSTMKEISQDLRSAVATNSTKSGAWLEKEKSVEKIIKKSSAKKRMWQKLGLFAGAVIIIPCTYLLVTDITESSPFEKAPVFQIIDLSEPTLSPTYQHDLTVMLNDQATTLSALRTQRIKTGNSLGQFYMLNGKWSDAITQYTKLEKEDVGLGRSTEYQMYLGKCYLHLNKLQEASAHMLKGLRYILSSESRTINQNYSSDEMRRTIIGVNNVNANIIRSIYAYLVAIAEKEKLYDKAQKYMDDLHFWDERIASDKGASYQFIGNPVVERTQNSAYRADLLRLNKNEESVAELKKLLEGTSIVTVSDWKPKLYLILGLSYMQLGKFRDAVEAFNEGLGAGAEEREIKKALRREYCRALWADGQVFKAIVEKVGHSNQ